MLDAMQPSIASAPARRTRRATSTWTDGVRVAQFTKVRPDAPCSRESPVSANTRSWAASSVTTVKTRSARAVTSARLVHAAAPNSAARAWALAELVSYTAVIDPPQSFRRRAMLPPMRPTPTKAIFSFTGLEEGDAGVGPKPEREGQSPGPAGRFLSQQESGQTFSPGKKGIVLLFLFQRGQGAMAARQHGVGRKGQDFLAVMTKLGVVMRGAAAHRSGEKGIADDGEGPGEAGNIVGGLPGEVPRGEKRF